MKRKASLLLCLLLGGCSAISGIGLHELRPAELYVGDETPFGLCTGSTLLFVSSFVCLGDTP